MNRIVLMSAALLGAALSFATAQDVPPNGEKQDRNGNDALQAKGTPTEVRVYLWDKTNRSPVDLKDWTASLQVESKGALKKTFPMMLTHPRPDDKMAVGHEGQMKDVNDQWWCEMVVVKKEDFRKNGDFRKDDPLKKDDTFRKDESAPKGTDPSRPGTVEPPPLPRDPGGPTLPKDQTTPGEKDPTTRPQDKSFDKPQDRRLDKDVEDWKRTHTHAGSYFKAELSGEEMPSPEFTATVVLKHKGETKTVTGFRYPFMMKDFEQRKNGPADAPKPGDTPGIDKPGTPKTPGTPDADKPSTPGTPNPDRR